MIFNSLHGLYAKTRQPSHVPDAISTFQQRYDFLVLFAFLVGGLHAAFFSAKLSTPIDVLLPPTIETILDITSLNIRHFSEYCDNDGCDRVDLAVGVQRIEADVLDIDAYFGLVQNLKASQDLERGSAKREIIT